MNGSQRFLERSSAPFSEQLLENTIIGVYTMYYVV